MTSFAPVLSGEITWTEMFCFCQSLRPPCQRIMSMNNVSEKEMQSVQGASGYQLSVFLSTFHIKD